MFENAALIRCAALGRTHGPGSLRRRTFRASGVAIPFFELVRGRLG